MSRRITLDEFSRDIKSRENCCIIVNYTPALPVKAAIHISKIIIVATHPEVIVIYDGDDYASLSCINWIEVFDDHYIVSCGGKDNYSVAKITFDSKKSIS